MTDISNGLVRPQKGSLEEWETFSEIGASTAVGRISSEWFTDVSALVRAQISNNTAPPKVLESVQRHNPNSFWGIFRKNDSSHEMIGVYGQLLLNQRGHQALLANVLDRLNPSLMYLAELREKPAAVYIWCVVAKKRGAVLQAALMKQLQDQHGMPYYAALATQDSFRIGKQIGFQPVRPTDDCIGGLFKLPDTIPTLRNSIVERAVAVKTVETPTEFSHVQALRAATFVAEQNCPVIEEFDGNDFSAQHLIGYVGDAPAAAMRIRYFGSFAKWERFCVLPTFRRSSVKDRILDFAGDIARRKGFEEIYFHAETRLSKFWEKRGFVRCSDRVIRFSGTQYLEFSKRIQILPDVLTPRSDPMVLNRIEGHWEQAGILDRSTTREAA